MRKAGESLDVSGRGIEREREDSRTGARGFGGWSVLFDIEEDE